MKASSKLILHHKDVSPYSEKIRLMLGYCNMPWLSVQAPLTPPRPSIDPIVGGYRRIPVAQLGADVFCDTRIIAAEIANIAGNSNLNPFNQVEDHKIWAEHIENRIFVVAISTMPLIGGAFALLSEVPLRLLASYIADKKHLFRNSSADYVSSIPNRKQGKLLWKKHLDQIEASLLAKYLGGDSPKYLDFCAVHAIWFRSKMETRPLFKGRPKLAKWYQRMINFAHGTKEEISPAKAIAIAKGALPRGVDSSMKKSHLIGKHVSIATTDVELGETKGVLVGESTERWIIERHSEATGLVHIHFPRETYQMTVLES